MDIIFQLVDIVLHIDKYLNIIIQIFGIWSYVILFLIVFCETGLVVTPFLPGDSLLFAAGAFAAIGSFDVTLLIIIFSSAAIIGDNVNYWIGHFVGPKIFYRENVRFLNKKYLDRTHAFYERHGGKTVILARFMPIIRTFMPFVAGVGRMYYPRFLAFDITGGIAWPSIFVLSGYFFGNIPVVKKYFSLVVIAIIVISVTPIIYQVLRMRFQKEEKKTIESSERSVP
ncbi:MAG: DedA family protein [Spirochaetes bacterium]|nr:DedA family protein [Spirochaetota bacterium]